MSLDIIALYVAELVSSPSPIGWSSAVSDESTSWFSSQSHYTHAHQLTTTSCFSSQSHYAHAHQLTTTSCFSSQSHYAHAHQLTTVFTKSHKTMCIIADDKTFLQRLFNKGPNGIMLKKYVHTIHWNTEKGNKPDTMILWSAQKHWHKKVHFGLRCDINFKNFEICLLYCSTTVQKPSEYIFNEHMNIKIIYYGSDRFIFWVVKDSQSIDSQWLIETHLKQAVQWLQQYRLYHHNIVTNDH